MIVLLGLVLLVVAAVVLLGGSVSGLIGGRSGSDRTGLGVPLAVVVTSGVGVVVVLAVVALVGLGGLRSGRPSSSPSEPAPPETVPERVAEDPGAPLAGPKSMFDGLVRLDAARSDLRPAPSIGDLDDGDVLDVRATGFVGGAEGVIAQCPDRRTSRCTNLFPVRADNGGRVRIPYRLVEGAATLVVEIDGERADASLAFGKAAPVAPRLSAADGSVEITGATPGAAVRIARCRADVVALDQCAVGPSLRLDRNGSGRFGVGAERDAQRIVVVGEGSLPLAEPFVLPGRPGPEVDLDPTRLALGLALALSLVGVAVALIRSTDWRPPADAATPFLDVAVLDG